jgi:RHS repeat-associated protein
MRPGNATVNPSPVIVLRVTPVACHRPAGRKDVFRSDGLWLRTVFAADPGHPIQATYNGSSQLTTVAFPDGRSDTFTYHPGGKLATITENPVVGSGTLPRTWTFLWTGDELTLATRPDGTSWELFYDPARPGYLTRMDLVSGSLRRVVAAFEYQAGTNNVAKSWRGDPSFTGPNAVDKVTYSFTNPALPTQTVVTKTVSATFDQVTTYGIGRDTVSRKPKLLSMQGTCPACGLSPFTSFAYTWTNPLLPSSMTDARLTRTDYTYTADGRLATKTEAANVPLLTRLTTYTYDASFPGLVTRVEVPSTSGGSNKRRTDSVYNATSGLLESRTVDGSEGGAPLPAGYKTTSYTYNGSGEPATLDPPGFGTSDVTTFTYGLPGRNGHVADTRIDPLVGATTFGFDGLNRRTSVIDPNNVEMVTAYDVLSRVTEVRRKGAVPADDLVTTSTYNAFGDLFCTRLPRGNGVEYVYDEAGRLKELRRGTTVATPTSTTCLDTAQPRERTIWQLDGAGNRVEESLERWNGSAWVSESRTTHTYTCHLDKATRGAGSAAPSVTEYCYDLDDNLVNVWDPNHPEATNTSPTQLYTYDALNRLTTVTVGTGTPGAATTRYGYDVQDHLASVTDAEGNVTTYTFSDRDLLTQQVSPASGTSTFTYNEHGEQVTEMDARNVVAIRTTDALDRVTAVSYPDIASSIGYTYDAGAFGKGRLTGITRNGETVSSTYDRFGRTLQDGALTYGYDKNGNRTSIAYPGAVTATYTHDFADREATLIAQVGASPPATLVSTALYKPFGPLASLTLGNGLTETRAFDARYAPTEICVDGTGTLLRWSYATDPVGNVTGIIDLLNAANNRTYGYQDPQYFLTQGDGPWGARSWTYDKIGNRLTETRDTTTDIYTYLLNGAGGHTPKIDRIERGDGTTLVYGYDASGDVESDGRQPFAYGDDRRMAQAGQGGAGSVTSLAYDGRGYLSKSVFELPGALHTDDTLPTYGSEGLLYHRFAHRSLQPYSALNPVRDSDLYVFYFAGRPVATLNRVAQGRPGDLLTTSTWQYLTTDHLGTPILAADTAGAQLWQGGFEPFGGDYSAAPTPLRFPGQWFDATWNGNKDAGLYYNVHRWYGVGVGRYTTPDLLGIREDVHLYAYVGSSPSRFMDPLGLARITNDSCVQIYIKPENGSQLVVLNPGEKRDGDGFYNASPNSCSGFCGRGAGQGSPTPEAYKINNLTDVTITGGCSGGCLEFKTSGPISWAANTLDPRTGWQGADFFNKHRDWPTPPKPPKPCCAPPH